MSHHTVQPVDAAYRTIEDERDRTIKVMNSASSSHFQRTKFNKNECNHISARDSYNRGQLITNKGQTRAPNNPGEAHIHHHQYLQDSHSGCTVRFTILKAAARESFLSHPATASVSLKSGTAGVVGTRTTE
jgi:hypothetical protein